MIKFDFLQYVKKEYIQKNKLLMDDIDELKPWGAYYRFDASQKEAYMGLFYSGFDLVVPGNISPKLLIFEPGKKLSLQYHERRDEIWVVLEGEIEAYFGEGDQIGDYRKYEKGDIFTYSAGVRHKAGAIGANWAVVGEIWRHTDQKNLSTEDDNIRLSDDFGRA